MKDVNKVLLIGRLGTDPVQRETKNGLAVVHFPVATSRRVVEQEEGAETKERDETQWHKVVVWGKQAEACKQHLEKGQAVFVEGSVRTRKYKTKEGDPRFSFEVHAENVSFLGRKRGVGAFDPASALEVEVAASA
jgi:single-strand DNA-binding protein